MAIRMAENGIQIIKVPIKDFKLVWCDKPKRNVYGNFINANYFGKYDEKNEDGSTTNFTLPVAHLLCDIDYDSENNWEKHYQNERGVVIDNGKRWLFNSNKWDFMNEAFYQKSISTLLISKTNKALIVDIKDLSEAYANDYKYAVSGVPCLKDGQDVKWYDYCAPQGWGADTVRNTWHNFVAIKYGDEDNVYLMQWQSNNTYGWNKTGNLIYSAEFYKKVKDLGFKDIIKLDGGGSFICRSSTLGIDQYTDENRRINCIITFDEVPVDEDKNEKIYELEAENAKLKQQLKEAGDSITELNDKYNTLRQLCLVYRSNIQDAVKNANDAVKNANDAISSISTSSDVMDSILNSI